MERDPFSILAKARQAHLRQVKAIHEKNLVDGWGCVMLPDALDRNYPRTSIDCPWPWIFP